MSEKVTIEVAESDMANLREWAHNSGQAVEAVVQQALQRYMAAVRADHADLDRRLAGPEYDHDEAMQVLAERRRLWRGEAAE